VDAIASLRASLAAGTKPVYILQGLEQLFVDQAERAILEAAVDDPRDSMSVTRLDLAEAKTGGKDIVGACRALGLFATRIAVVVRAAQLLDKKTEARDEVVRYLESPVAACTLILRTTVLGSKSGGVDPKSAALDGRTALVKRAKKHGEVLTFKELYPRQAAAWVADRIRGLGHPLERGAAEALVELAGCSLLALANTVDQLSLFVGPRAPIRLEDIETCLAATRGHTVFELVDAVGQRRPADALRHLEAMLSQREPPLRILASLIGHFRNLWQVRLVRARTRSLDEAKQALPMHPFVVQKLWAQAPRFDDRFLRHAYERLYATDLALKSSPLRGQVVLERLVLELAA